MCVGLGDMEISKGCASCDGVGDRGSRHGGGAMGWTNVGMGGNGGRLGGLNVGPWWGSRGHPYFLAQKVVQSLSTLSLHASL